MSSPTSSWRAGLGPRIARLFANLGGVARRRSGNLQADADCPAPYGNEAERLLLDAQPALRGCTEGLKLECLRAASRDRARQTLIRGTQLRRGRALHWTELAAHVSALFEPGLRGVEHRERARQLGRLHAALGTPEAINASAFRLLRRNLAACRDQLPGTAVQRQLFMDAALCRLEADMSYQREGADRLQRDLLGSVSELSQRLQAVQSRRELLAAAVEMLARLPYVAMCAAYTQNVEGLFVLEAQSATQQRWTLDHPGLALLETVAGENEDALLRACWLSGTITDGPCIESAAAQQQPWAVGLLRDGVSSAVSVPVVDWSGQVLLTFRLYGRLPGQFQTRLMRHTLNALRFGIAAELARVNDGIAPPTVPAVERAHWREHLFAGGLRMFMQPIVDLRGQTCTRVEALARLELDRNTILPPARFLPVLSHQELDRLFIVGLDQALQSVRAWEREGVLVDLSVNLPPSTLRNDACVGWVREALSRHGMMPNRLNLEILESRAIADPNTMRRIAEQLHELGVSLALDDLGAGYSSLLRLNNMPFDLVKIDQELVHGAVSNNPRAAPLVWGLVQLARSLGLKIAIEGLETQMLLEFAQYLQADYGQGHAIARPMPPEMVPAWIKGWRLPPLSGINPFGSLLRQVP